MQEIKLCRMENWIKDEDLTGVCSKKDSRVIVGAPCEKLKLLQETGYCVLAELTHMQGLTEEEIAEALCKEETVLQYKNVSSLQSASAISSSVSPCMWVSSANTQ